jgi:hypothetical protein
MHRGSAFPAHTRVTYALATPDARLMARAAIFFASAVLVHNADHLRRGGDWVSAVVFWLGSGAIILEVGLVALVFMRHAAAPLAAAIGGFALRSVTHSAAVPPPILHLRCLALQSPGASAVKMRSRPGHRCWPVQYRQCLHLQRLLAIGARDIYRAIRAAGVLGTRHLLEYAAAAGAQYLVPTSTVGVERVPIICFRTKMDQSRWSDEPQERGPLTRPPAFRTQVAPWTTMTPC